MCSGTSSISIFSSVVCNNVQYKLKSYDNIERYEHFFHPDLLNNVSSAVEAVSI